MYILTIARSPSSAADISLNDELLPSTVQVWKSSSWYETDTDCANGPHGPGCRGAAVVGNLTDILEHGHAGLLSGPWYLGESTRWPAGYTADPATNKTCTYPAGMPPNCSCFEEGNETDTHPHPQDPGGCYDVQDDNPRFDRVLGGEVGKLA